MNFQILQAHLAFFGRDKLKLNQLFEQSKLIGSDNPHPFLHKLDASQHHDIVSFYQSYLSERLRYFRQCKREKDYKAYYFLKPERNKWKSKDKEYYNELRKKYLKMPINLPRGLFKDALISWFVNNGSEQMKKLVSESERVNTIYMMQKYFEYDRHHDGNQEFYDFTRSYEVINKLFDKRTGRDRYESLVQKPFTGVELKNKIEAIKDQIARLPEADKDGVHIRAKRKKEFVRFTKNEKIIRHSKASDMLLFLLAKEMLFAQMGTNLEQQDFKLRDIKPDEEKGVLSTRIPFSLSLDYFETNERGVITKERNQLGSKDIVQQALKIKNYGDFRRFVNDRRLNMLFQWIGDHMIDRAALEKELEGYDKARLEAAQCIYQFEKGVCEKLSPYKKPGENYIRNEKILVAFYAEFEQYADDQLVVKQIRNTFSHNQYPDANIFSSDCPIAFPGIATGIVELLKEKTDRYMNELQTINQE